MRMRSRPVARLVPMSFISSCRFTSQAPRGSVCASPRKPAGLPCTRKRHQQRRADLQLGEARRLGGLLLARRARCRATPRAADAPGATSATGRRRAACPARASGPALGKRAARDLHFLDDPAHRDRARARKAQSGPVASRSSSRLRRRQSSTASRRMFWKSTAILVQRPTSMPDRGLGCRPVQASAERMSEAVKSAGLSGGRLVMGAGDLSPTVSRAA